MALGKLHLLVLHFPIALVLAAALADVLWLWRRKTFFGEAGFYCLLVGAISAVPTMAAGLMLISTMSLSGQIAQLGEVHESLGIITTTVVLLTAGLRVALRNRLSGLWGWAYGVLMLASVVLITLTGHYGGLLAFGPDYLSGIF
ncbi:MAG: DUF2231 domain-containing protein [Phycisphaerae bacterium]|jgi:uncharacterized membrane protein